MTKLTDKELWDALDKVTAESELEDAFEKTHEEHVRSLEAQGFDIEKLNAQADALFDQVEATRAPAPAAAHEPEPAPAHEPETAPAHENASVTHESAAAPAYAPEPPPARVRPLSRRPLYAVPSALAVAAGVLLILHGLKKPPIPIGPDVIAPEVAQAITVRRQALAACNAMEWRKCLDDLNQARTLDPAGDAATEPRNLRATAEQGLRDMPPEPPPHRPGPDDGRKIPK
jgi:hypothetical protein